MVLNSNTFALVDGVRSVTETVSELLRIQPIHTQISSLESRTVIQEALTVKAYFKHLFKVILFLND